LKQLYQRLLAQKKTIKVAIVPVMRKLLVTLNVMVREEKNVKRASTRSSDQLRQPMAPNFAPNLQIFW
jgi:hypothetical protein